MWSGQYFLAHHSSETNVSYTSVNWVIIGSDNGLSSIAWLRHQMETFSALLAICAGNSSVTGEIPAQRLVAGSFNVIFDLRLNKRLSKQSWGWWSETPSRSFWRHCNVVSTHLMDQCSGLLFESVGSKLIEIWIKIQWSSWSSWISNISIEIKLWCNISKRLCETAPVVLLTAVRSVSGLSAMEQSWTAAFGTVISPSRTSARNGVKVVSYVITYRHCRLK